MGEVTIHTDMMSSYGWTARHVATEKGIDHEVAPIDRQSPALQRLHPFGKMPVLQHGKIIVYETLAITHYLDRAFPGPALQPLDVLAQSQMLRWISVYNSYLFPVLKALVQESAAPSLAGGEADPAVLEGLRAPLARVLALMGEALLEHPFLVGARLTLADSFVFPYLHFAAFTAQGARAVAAQPAVEAWLGRIRERPSFAATDPFAAAA